MSQFTKAQALHQKNRFKEALNIYLAIKGKDRVPAVDIYQSLCLQQLGRTIDAKNLIQKVNHEKLTSYAEVMTTAIVFKLLGETGECINLLERAESKFPPNLVTYVNLASCYLSINNLEKCEVFLQKGYQLGKPSIELLLNFAMLELQRDNLEEAREYLDRAKLINPGHRDIRYLTGKILFKEHDIDNCVNHLVSCLESSPSYISPWKLLSAALNDSPDLSEAVLKRLGIIYKILKQNKTTSQAVISNVINIQKKTVYWVELEYFENTLVKLLENAAGDDLPQSFVMMTLPIKQRLITQSYYNEYRNIFTPKPKSIRSSQTKSICFISSDLRNHAVGHLLKGIARSERSLRDYDCLYTGNRTNHALEKELASAFANYSYAGDSSANSIIETIKERNYDLVVDLNGHTGSSNIYVLSQIEIPVVHWLGMPSSTGSSYFDYLLCDETVLQNSEGDEITEKPIYLPQCYVPSAEFISSEGKQEVFTFASFQNLYKLNSDLLKTWSAIMKNCVGAKFQISANFDKQQNLRILLEEYGFDLAQIEFVRPLPHEKHIERLGKVHCILDTFPYNGGTSCAEALSCGVPIVTKYGSSIVSRVGASIVKAAGLECLVASTNEEYIQKATLIYSGGITEEAITRDIKNSYFLDPNRFANDLYNTLTNIKG